MTSSHRQNSLTTTPDAGGQGADVPAESMSRSDMVLYRRAVRLQWNVPPELMDRLPQRLLEIIDKGDPRDAIAASRVAEKIVRSMQPTIHAHLHQHSGAEGKDREMSVDEYRRAIIARATGRRDVD